MKTAAITIAIPAYNSAPTVGRAVRSALAQGDDVAVVLVDDASSDGTADAARAADDGTGRLTVLSQPVNSGPAAARNRAVAASKSPWIALLDSDDFMEPGRLAALRSLAETEGLDFAADDLWKVDEEDVAGPKRRLLAGVSLPFTLDLRGFISGNLAADLGPDLGPRHEYGFLKPLMRRAFLDEHGIAYDETMRLGEDYDLYARALAKGARFRVVEPLGYVAVVRQNSLSSQHTTRDLERIVVCDRRLIANPEIDAETRTVLEAHLREALCEWHWRRLIDAVRERRVIAAIAAFRAPLYVGSYLLGCLASEARRRLLARFTPEERQRGAGL